MDQSLRNFSIYVYIKYMLHSSDTTPHRKCSKMTKWYKFVKKFLFFLQLNSVGKVAAFHHYKKKNKLVGPSKKKFSGNFTTMISAGGTNVVQRVQLGRKEDN